MISKEEYESAVVPAANEILMKFHGRRRILNFIGNLNNLAREARCYLSEEDKKNHKTLERSLHETKESMNPEKDSVLINMETGETRIVNIDDASLVIDDNEEIAFIISVDNIRPLCSFVDSNVCGVEIPELFASPDEFYKYAARTYEMVAEIARASKE